MGVNWRASINFWSPESKHWSPKISPLFSSSKSLNTNKKCMVWTFFMLKNCTTSNPNTKKQPYIYKWSLIRVQRKSVLQPASRRPAKKFWSPELNFQSHWRPGRHNFRPCILVAMLQIAWWHNIGRLQWTSKGNKTKSTDDALTLRMTIT